MPMRRSYCSINSVVTILFSSLVIEEVISKLIQLYSICCGGGETGYVVGEVKPGEHCTINKKYKYDTTRSDNLN